MRDICLPVRYNSGEVIPMRDIAKNIRDLRSRKNMTQDELAEQLFVTRQTVSNYETGKSRPDVEMLARIAELLETDVNALIYGPAPDAKKDEQQKLIIGAAVTILASVLYAIFHSIAKKLMKSTFYLGPMLMVIQLLFPLFLFGAGWTLMQLTSMALKWKPKQKDWFRWIGFALSILLLVLFVLTVWHCIAVSLNDYLFINHIRGEWIETVNEVDGSVSHGWHSLPPPVPYTVSRIVSWFHHYVTDQNPWLYPLLGAVLWFFGIPKRKEA